MKNTIQKIAGMLALMTLMIGCSGSTHWAGLGSSQVVNVINVGTITGDLVTDSWADERGFGQGADLRWKSKGDSTEPEPVPGDEVYEEATEEITEPTQPPIPTLAPTAHNPTRGDYVPLLSETPEGWGF